MDTSRDYWAALPFEDFINEAHSKIGNYYDYLESSGLYYVLERCFKAYYGANLAVPQTGNLFDVASIQRAGQQGELSLLKINDYRNYLQHLLQLATSQKTALTCRASNTDAKSQAQVILGRGILDYYMTEKKLGRHISQAAEKGIALLEGWAYLPWNPTKGEIYDRHPETGAPLYQGDLECSTHTMLDVVRDIELNEESEHGWYFLRLDDNKFNLIATNPEVAEEIFSMGGGYEYESRRSFSLNITQRLTNKQSEKSDRLTKWVFMHRKTEAMKKGRLCLFTGKVRLFDGPIPYREMPLRKFSPQNIIGTPFGYSPAVEILGGQQALDILDATIMSNNATFGVQNVWTKNQDTITIEQLKSGLNHMQSDEMPKAVQLTATAPETFTYRNTVKTDMGTLVGVSNTVRGMPDASLKSGNALALVVSQSVQFSSLIEEGVSQLKEDMGGDVINQLRDFGKTPRAAAIVGEAMQPYMEEFTGDDLSMINRVVIEQVNPLSKTVAGCVQLAENYADRGWIKSPDQYTMVLSTGNIGPVMEATQSKELNMAAEKRAVRIGKPVRALKTDHHANHIQSILELLDNPEARKDPRLLNAALAHAQEHYDLWTQVAQQEPWLLELTGQSPPPPPGQQPGMGGPPPGAASHGQAGPIPGKPQSNGPVMNNENPMLQNQPGMPNMPNLPPGSPPEAQGAYDKVQMPQAGGM